MVRRDLLKKLFSIGSEAAVAGVIGVPAVISLLSPILKRRTAPRWRPLGKVEGFPVGKITKAVMNPSRGDWAGSIREQAVYVWRKRGDEFVVFSRSCTDVGCPVNYDDGSRCFFCPCHGGIFAQGGEPMAGPPPRPLYRYATRVRDGDILEIDLRSVPPMV